MTLHTLNNYLFLFQDGEQCDDSRHGPAQLQICDMNGKEQKKLVTTAKEARKSSWAVTGSAAVSTANNGTSAGVFALVRTHWFYKPLSFCTDEDGVLCSNPRLAGRVIRVEGRDILLFTAYSEHSVGFRTDINTHA